MLLSTIGGRSVANLDELWRQTEETFSRFLVSMSKNRLIRLHASHGYQKKNIQVNTDYVPSYI